MHPPEVEKRSKSLGHNERKKVKRRRKRAKEGRDEKKKVYNMNNLEEVDMDIDFDKLVKNEYARLQRQYRLMEDERHSVAAKGKALSKQAKLLDILYDELRGLKTDIYNAKNERRERVDGESHGTIIHIMEQYDAANVEVAHCLKNMKEMVVHVDRIVKILIRHKLKVNEIYGRSLSYAQIQRKREMLENRLYNYTVRFDTKVSENKKIRHDEINMNIKLRGLFHNRYIELKHQLAQIRARMGEVVYFASLAYDQHGDKITQARVIRERNDRENRQHVNDMKDCNRVLHRDSIIRSFLSTKNWQRNIIESEKQRAARKNVTKLYKIEKLLQKYIQSFHKILEKSHHENLEGLLKEYSRMQVDNFSNFRYNSDLNHEIIMLREDTLSMSFEIDTVYKRAKETELKREKELDGLIKSKRKLEREAELLGINLENAEMNIVEISQIVQGLFRTIGCRSESLARFLGTNSTGELAPRYIPLCMHLINERASELVRYLSQLEIRKEAELGTEEFRPKENRVGVAANLKSSGGPFLPTVIVSSHFAGDDEEEDKSTVKPLTRNQVHASLMRQIEAERNQKRNSQNLED